VRTTLKRGHGRTALDGNGSGRSTLPPDALSPMTLYQVEEPPPKSRLRRVGRMLGWILLGLVMIAAGLGGGAYLFYHESVAATAPRSPDVIKALHSITPVTPHHAAIALVLGYDHRAGEGNANSRSDSMMLLRADPATHTISMLSLPRDMLVDVRCPGKDYGLYKINAAYSFCGAAGSLLTVKALTGLPINYLITVNFRGFKKIVNTLGGVWIDVDRRYYNNQAGPYGYAKINLQPGYQRLTGGAALDFVRFRHTDSDLFRVARQQLFVQAMKAQFKSAFSFSLGGALNAAKVINILSENVEIGPRVSGETIYNWAGFIHDLPSGHFFQAKIANLTGASDLTTDTSNITTAVQQFTSPSIQQVKEANTVALGGTVKQTVPQPGQTSILVLNGNGQPGSAANLSSLLGNRGYRMLQPPPGKTANAPTFGYGHTKVYYLDWSKRGKAAAASLAEVLAPADAEPIPRDLLPLRGTAMLLVIVGHAFQSLTPVIPQPVIKHQAPNVVSNRAATQTMVRDAQRHVPFPLMVPTVLESSSVPDPYPDPAIRTYDISGKHKAVRLVFRTGAPEYWGVEETDWQDAPVLNEKNFHRVIGGRSYSFYYHGTHLHMVVLQVGKTGYWVVNTLVDALSNETMIAIAKGLQPLDQAKVRKAPGRT
jgi:LCP family protein required for cell wall assembly